MEISGHPHRSHRPHIRLCRSHLGAHPTHPEPTKRLAGQHLCEGQLFYTSLRFSDILFFFLVLHWGDSSGDGSRDPRDCQRDPVCPPEQHQSQVGSQIYNFTLKSDVCIYFCLVSCSLEVGRCIAVQVCMLQIPILVVFNACYVCRHSWFPVWIGEFQQAVFMQSMSVFFRMWALSCCSVTCTCGPAYAA